MDTEKLSLGVENTLNNQYFFWSVMLFAVVFGWLARPPLPSWLLKMFENPVFQYVVLFGVVYTGSKDLKASIWSPLIFMGIMYLLSFTENRSAPKFSNENFQTDDAADADADAGEEAVESDEQDLPESDIPEDSGVEDDEEEEEPEPEEGFQDANATDVERVKYAKKLKRGLSELKDQTEDLYTTATSLVDTYPEKNSNVNEGFADYGTSYCGCI